MSRVNIKATSLLSVVSVGVQKVLYCLFEYNTSVAFVCITRVDVSVHIFTCAVPLEQTEWHQNECMNHWFC